MKPTSRRRPKAQPCAEALESRSLLTSGAGNTFALVPATIEKPGGTTVVKFTIDPALFTRPRGGKLLVGIDVVAGTGEKAEPRIQGVDALGAGNVHPTHLAVQRTPGARAVIVSLDGVPHHPDRAASYTVTVAGLHRTAGKVLVGFYLPGDASGDGVVDATDLKTVQAAMGSNANDTRYDFESDVNRDGHINAADLAVARQNLGAKTTVTPVISANLDPASNSSGDKERITNVRNVHFTGTGTPGATITYAEIQSRTAPLTTKTDASGQYSLVIPLADGLNTFRVTSTDPFGQTISGQIAPVTYSASALTAKAPAPPKG